MHDMKGKDGQKQMGFNLLFSVKLFTYLSIEKTTTVVSIA